jgi:GLPGLI family protein
MKSIVTIFIFLLSGMTLELNAQARFIDYGKITFERSQNQYLLIGQEKIDASMVLQEMAKTYPHLIKDQFVLDFNANQSSYKLAKENEEQKIFWEISSPNMDNKRVMNFKENTSAEGLTFYGASLLVEDNLRKYTWKIADEVRTIAGFECRKATTTICDSVVVVAFFTDEIPVSGGPESFNGLPGMILGLAVPRLYTTWFATKLELVTPASESFIITGKRKKKTFTEYMQEVVKAGNHSEDESRQRFLWEANL